MNIFNSIIVICSYCKKIINIKDGEGVSGTSHGICNSCLTPVKRHLKKRLAKQTQRVLSVS